MASARFELAPFFWTPDCISCPYFSQDSVRLFWTKSGYGIVNCGERSALLRPHCLIALGVQDFFAQVIEPISGYCVEVSEEFITSSFPRPIFPSLREFFQQLRCPILRIHFSQRARGEAEWLLQRMLREDPNMGDLFWTSIHLTFGQFLLTCYQQWMLNENDKEQVSAAAENVIRVLRSYIDEHLHEEFGLKQLSERAGYAPSYLSSLFSKVNGQGVTEYINRRRVARAQELLRESNLKIIEVCYQVGFKDLAHFNRTFKRFVGIAPNQFRQAGIEERLRGKSPSRRLIAANSLSHPKSSLQPV